MKFVRPAQRISGSFTTEKGKYINRKGRVTNHARKAAEPVSFVGVDGEGVTERDSSHKYVLFGIGENQISNPAGLNYRTVFDFAYGLFRPRTAFVGFYLGYDFTQILKTLTEHEARMLLTSEGQALRKHKRPGLPAHPVMTDEWYLDMLGMKRLKIRPKTCSCEVATCPCEKPPWMYICDVGAFFQSSFLKVIDPKSWEEGKAIVTPEEYETILEGKEKRSTAVLDSDMLRYNRLENEILARVMNGLDKGFRDIKIYLPPPKWFGPGQSAQAWLTNENVITGKEVRESVPAYFLEAARMSYFGGWFEIMMHGIIPGVTYEYDINSAYPSIIANLPCLSHGKYTYGDGEFPKPLPEKALCLVYAEVTSPGIPNRRKSQYIGAALHRDSHGRILRPLASKGWYWWHELAAAKRAKVIGKIRVEKWCIYEPCDCPPPIAEIANLYQRRLDVGKNTPMGKAAKLVYNSDYGKFAQSVGEPMFGNPVYASLITAGCRTVILDAIGTHPEGMAAVAMVATDAVFFLSPHPSLPISSKLGEWDYAEKQNLTLFKPGVYWDDKARNQIERGESPSFKARGFSARDFANAIRDVDSTFRNWEPGKTPWPVVKFKSNFNMVSGLQALRRGKWEIAGEVTSGTTLVQNADAADKRFGVFQSVQYGRTVWRSLPHYGLDDFGNAVSSHPYTKRFGMEDPFSDEYKAEMGITDDGSLPDILNWILRGE